MPNIKLETQVEAFTDGACSGNPGPGGWGALLRYGGNEKRLSGGEPDTTNNRMELMGAIMALESMKRPVRIRVTTDSQYVKKGITEWLDTWIKREWRTASKKPVKNIDLWKRLKAATEPHEVEWAWVKGHSGHVENEIADELARAGLEQGRI